MTDVQRHTTPIRARIAAIALTSAFEFVGASCSTSRPATDLRVSGTAGTVPSMRMPDGTLWTTANLAVNMAGSSCYEDAEANCRRYGRLYTWDAAQQGCQSLKDGWRLPTNDEWRRMAKHYGGVRDDSDDTGHAAYTALLAGGRAGFNALLGGNRSEDGKYARLEAHGFFWTASESDAGHAWFYNFGRGGVSLNRHREGDKRMAISVRCVRE